MSAGGYIVFGSIANVFVSRIVISISLVLCQHTKGNHEEFLSMLRRGTW